MRCLVEIFKPSNTAFNLVPDYTESQSMPDFNIREKSGNAENFIERSKYAGCYDFSIQETRNV